MIAEIIEHPQKAEVIRSIGGDRHEILVAIQKLYCPHGFECDATFGNGQFYADSRLTRPAHCFDIEPLSEHATEADCRKLPIGAEAINSLIVDPPFLTYVRASRNGNGKMRLARRFSGFWRYEELEDHYRDTISEGYRVLKPDGILVFKCQDIIHNHKMHATHVRVINMAEVEGFRLEDLFVLTASHRMPSPNRAGTQKHARIFHSYFLVFRKIKCHKSQKEKAA